MAARVTKRPRDMTTPSGPSGVLRNRVLPAHAVSRGSNTVARQVDWCIIAIHPMSERVWQGLMLLVVLSQTN